MCPLHFAAYFDPEFNWHLLTTLPPEDVCTDDECKYEDPGGDESDLEYDHDDSEGEYEDCDPDDSEGDYEDCDGDSMSRYGFHYVQPANMDPEPATMGPNTTQPDPASMDLNMSQPEYEPVDIDSKQPDPEPEDARPEDDRH